MGISPLVLMASDTHDNSRRTHLAVDTKSLSSPPFSSSCSSVRASPVDCRPITTHCNTSHYAIDNYQNS